MKMLEKPSAGCIVLNSSANLRQSLPRHRKMPQGLECNSYTQWQETVTQQALSDVLIPEEALWEQQQ